MAKWISSCTLILLKYHGWTNSTILMNVEPQESKWLTKSEIILLFMVIGLISSWNILSEPHRVHLLPLYVLISSHLLLTKLIVRANWRSQHHTARPLLMFAYFFFQSPAHNEIVVINFSCTMVFVMVQVGQLQQSCIQLYWSHKSFYVCIKSFIVCVFILFMCSNSKQF